jgi:cell fate regulator YaaT (PSP1 superfamily)
MSEEKKQNTNQGGGHKPHHYHHRHKGHKKPANPEKKDNVQAQQASNANAENVATVQQKNPPEKASGSNHPKHDGKKRNHKNQRHDRNQDRDQARSATEETQASYEESIDDAAVFAPPFFSMREKEKKVSRVDIDTSDISPLSDDELFGTSHLIHKEAASDESTTEIVGIRFKSGGKIYYFDPDGTKATVGSFAVVDTARGLEFGEICIANRQIKSSGIVQPLRKVIRLATKEDIAHHNSNTAREKDAFKICLEKIAAHKLDMKLVDAQYSFDNSKLLFYFTSAGRVDFRELVRDLASVFKTRIELRQIGIRDEAKMLGGIGMCGRPLCCSRHLSNFAQVSIKMAKEQGLSLNANKISGNCGRLMCCLNFENQVYIDEIKVTPMPGSIVKIGGNKGVVVEAHPLTGMLKVHLDGTPDNEKISTHRNEVSIISRKLPDASPENDSKDVIVEE